MRKSTKYDIIVVIGVLMWMPISIFLESGDVNQTTSDNLAILMIIGFIIMIIGLLLSQKARVKEKEERMKIIIRQEGADVKTMENEIGGFCEYCGKEYDGSGGRLFCEYCGKEI